MSACVAVGWVGGRWSEGWGCGSSITGDEMGSSPFFFISLREQKGKEFRGSRLKHSDNCVFHNCICV